MLHDFRSAEEEEESRYFFLFSPKERRRVVAPKGLSNALFYFGKDDATVQACFATWKIVCKVDDEGNRNDFYPFPSSPPVSSPFSHVSQDVNAKQLPNVDGTDLSPSQNCAWIK